MRQGASRHALVDRRDDLYETPAVCTRAALRARIFEGMEGGCVWPGGPGAVWEPCAGRGAIARELRAAGYAVVAQDLVDYPGRDLDIATGIDFLMERVAPAAAKCIITNPPYKLADAFVRHGLRLVPRVFAFLRFMAVEGVGRSDLIDRHCRAIWVGADRPPAMHREGWTGPKLSNSSAPFAWFLFDARPRPEREPIALRRLMWRA